MLARALPRQLATLFFTFAASPAAAAPYDFRENYKSSAPAPDEGPPASYHAVRDPSLLVYDVVGLVGGYVLTVLIFGILLLTVGRRMRRRALQPPKALELELQDKDLRPAIRTSSLTSPPLSARSATSWLRKFKKSDSAVGSPTSPTLQSPTSFDQKVIDAHNSRQQADMERLYAAVMDHDAKKHYSKLSMEDHTEAPKLAERRRPSAISTTRSHADDSPTSPVKAIYPPGYNGPKTAPIPGSRGQDQYPPASPRSVVSKKSQNSLATNGTKNARFNLKNLRIAGPQRYPGVDSDDEAHTPLSSQFNPANAPPSPPTEQNSPTERDEALDRVQPLPRPAPQRLGSVGSIPENPNTLRVNTGAMRSASSSNSTLPLRSFAEPLKSPGIQTTVLDRRVDALSALSPKTGVPFTPYSPYMPFTPITPVTPHLVSKRDRKMALKAEGKRRVQREELVQSPKEIFGDAY